MGQAQVGLVPELAAGGSLLRLCESHVRHGRTCFFYVRGATKRGGCRLTGSRAALAAPVGALLQVRVVEVRRLVWRQLNEVLAPAALVGPVVALATRPAAAHGLVLAVL